MKWINKYRSTIILVLIFVIGLSLLLYPTVSDYWNSFHQSHAIATYEEKVADMDTQNYERMLQEAREYNETLVAYSGRWALNEEDKEEYETLLNVGGTGIMGYIEIPKIKVSLPVYHGIEEEILQIAIGHLAGTSLPVGGESTHCVLSGHRGLPSAKLFTNLDKMEEGDVFVFHVLNETMTYEVDQIRVVEPEDVSNLKIEEGKDLCTLVTCTPYGVNSHRLLVRGHRIENLTSDINVSLDAQQIDPVLVAPIVAAPVLLLVLIWILVHYRKKK